MLANEESIRQWRKKSEDLRPNAVNAAVGAYWTALGRTDDFKTVDIAAANLAAENALVSRIKREWLAKYVENHSPGSKARANAEESLDLYFRGVGPRLTLPEPPVVTELSVMQLATAAVVGAMGGILILAPLMHLLLDMREVGMVLGAPLGAFLFVIAFWYTARNTWLRWGLVGFLGVATLAEAWRVLTGGGILGRISSRGGGRGAALKRILFYILAMLLLGVIEDRRHLDRQAHDKAIRLAIDQWLDGVSLILGLLTSREEGRSTDAAADTRLMDLVQQVQELPRVAPDNLPAARAELLLSLKNMGFHIETAPARRFRWAEEHRERYSQFGLVELGDEVVVEREPIATQDGIHRKGLVRRVREGN